MINRELGCILPCKHRTYAHVFRAVSWNAPRIDSWTAAAELWDPS